MKCSGGYRIELMLTGCVITALLTQPAISSEPIADAGLPRYAAQDPVVLDGTGSYDPDDSGPLSYKWRQTSGPPVAIIDANTATPTIAGSKQATGRDPTAKPGDFTQTDEIQECEFELVVSDGELTSLPDTVKVIIVPDFGANQMRHVNPPFNPSKPTFIYFGGGDCIFGQPGLACTWDGPDWNSRANVIDFTSGYGPDPNYAPGNVDAPRTYYRLADMIIVYLSSVAPDYQQPIQTAGWSTGGQPAIDVGVYLNQTYADARYAVNRVTFIDATPHCRSEYSESIATFLCSSVDGEQCCIDDYTGTDGKAGPFHSWSSVYPSVLRVGSSLSHVDIIYWYGNSLMGSDMNQFNHGVVGGVYWSVLGPGKNLQLASTPSIEAYRFEWFGSRNDGHMELVDEPTYPGRLPEPVTLVEPVYTEDHSGVILSCEESENAVGYQLLFGPDPYHMVYLFSDTPAPPSDIVTSFPFEQIWWTIKIYDQYGSTIHADPLQITTDCVIIQMIENKVTGQRYASIQQALNDAHAGDEIVVGPGTWQYLENINFKGKNLIVRSVDPNNPTVVATTVINGGHHGSVVTFFSGEEESCVLDGLTITGGIIGISCRDVSPTIRNCTIGSPGSTAIEFWGSGPKIINCTILGNVIDHSLVAYWKLDEEVGDIAYDNVGGHDATLHGEPLWQPTGGRFAGALEFDGIDDYVSTPFVLNPAIGSFSVFAWIKSVAPGDVIITQAGSNGETWLSTNPLDGKLITGLGDTYFDVLESESIIVDGQWHHIGLVYDMDLLHRRLYVDEAVVAEDATFVAPQLSNDGLYIGVGKELDAISFFSGLIDDIRIYNQVVSP